MSAEPILVAKNETDIFLLPEMANRHGLIAGATGTGKTVTLQLLAESLSARGVPVFLADVKGDLAGISQPGGQSPKVQERVQQLKLDELRLPVVPSRSGMCSAKRAIRCARPFQKWDRCCWRVCCN